MSEPAKQCKHDSLWHDVTSQEWRCLQCHALFIPIYQQTLDAALKWQPRTPESNPQHPFVAIDRNGNIVASQKSDNIQNWHPCWNKFLRLPPAPVEVPEWERELQAFVSKYEVTKELADRFYVCTEAMLRAAARNPSILEPFKE